MLTFSYRLHSKYETRVRQGDALFVSLLSVLFCYYRTGHLFQGRYRSECVENDEYLLTVIRYIHNNPVKAGWLTSRKTIAGAASMRIMERMSI